MMIKQRMEWGSLFSDKPKPAHNSQLYEIDHFNLNVVMNKVKIVFFHQPERELDEELDEICAFQQRHASRSKLEPFWY